MTLFKLILILLIIFIVFGAGKLPSVMGDLGKAVRNFKKGLNEGEDEIAERKRITDQSEKVAAQNQNSQKPDDSNV